MKSNLICLVFVLFLTGSLAANYTWASTAGGSWSSDSNWNPNGVPGADDNVLFTYLSYDNDIVITFDGDVTVGSLIVDTRFFQFKSGSLTIQNDCLINAAVLYQVTFNINGDARFESTGSGGVDGILCDSCIINVKKSLVFASQTSGNTEIANNAQIITLKGATTTIGYESIHSAITQVGTLINYGTLIFANGFGYGSSPWGNPPVSETGPWAEIKNYGDIHVQVTGSTLGSPVYNDIKTWNFLDGKITLRVVQQSTTNEQGIFNYNYEYNDCISSGGAHDHYEVNIAGDVHIIFSQATVKVGQPEQPFNPKVGDFFPVFASFEKQSGSFRNVTSEGLGSGMVLGRKTKVDPGNGFYHVGVIICDDSDTACISSKLISGCDDSDTACISNSSASYLGLSFVVLFALIASLF